MTQHDVDRELNEAIGRLTAGESLASIHQAYPEAAELAQVAYRLQALLPAPTPDLAAGRRRFLSEAVQPTPRRSSIVLLFGQMWARPVLAAILVALMLATGSAVVMTVSGLFRRPTPTLTISPTPSITPATPSATPSLTPTLPAPTLTLTPTLPATRLLQPTRLPPTQPPLTATEMLPALPSSLPTEGPTTTPTLQPSLTPPPTGFPAQPSTALPTIRPTLPAPPRPTLPQTRLPHPTPFSTSPPADHPTHEPPPAPETTSQPPEMPRQMR
jgi:hypothetical protein